MKSREFARRTVPDNYIINQLSDVWIEHHGDRGSAENKIQWLKDFLDIDTDSNVAQLSDRLTRQEVNFITLTENPDVVLDEIAALVIAQEKLAGTYVVPEEMPVRKYHEYVLAEYPASTTITTIQAKLTMLTGDLSPLASAILDIRNTWAQRGVVPLDLDEQDTYWWYAVGSLFDCEYAGDDCTDEQDYLDNRRWEDAPVEHIDPPGHVWPPIFNFVMPYAYAIEYGDIEHTRTIHVYSCSGSICDESWEGDSSTYYSGSWAPPLGPNDGCGHLFGTGVKTTFEVDPDGNGTTMAYLHVQAHSAVQYDYDNGIGTQVAVATIKNIANNPTSYWCYSSSFTGYTIES